MKRTRRGMVLYYRIAEKNAAQARDASIKQFLSDGSAYWKTSDFIPLAGKRRLEGIRIRRLTISIMPPGEALWSEKV